MKNQRLIRIMLYTAVLLAAFFLIKRNKTAPEMEFSGLKLQDIEGIKYQVEEFKGYPVLLNFWQTWCGPCIKELPYFDNMAQKWDGLLIFVVTDEDFSLWKNYPEKYPNITFVKMDSTMREIGVTTFPTTYLLNAEGEKVYNKVGMRDWDSNATIKELKEKTTIAIK
jgi:thiol-disulfide isomerase/thioredoxin